MTEIPDPLGTPRRVESDGDRIRELVAAWNVFYLALPDGEYKGLGELRGAVRDIYASQWTSSAIAESHPTPQQLQTVRQPKEGQG